MLDARILIVGGGIAGFALARALRANGFRPELVDRASDWPKIGAGMYVPGNGVRAATALGLGDMLMARAVPLSHQRIMDHRGRLLAEIDLARTWGHVGPCVGITRADLHQVLLDGAVGVPVRLGTTVTALTQTGELVMVQLNGEPARSYDVVVGADGIRSSIRRLVFGEIRPRPIGQASWRFIAPDACGVTTWTAMLGRRRSFLMMPVGSGGLYCYADLTTRDGRDTIDAAAAEQRPGDRREDDRDRLRTLFRDFNGPVQGALEQLNTVESIHFGPIEELDVDPCVDGRVVLVGDAAHATSPNMAQGASMALEDALILTSALRSSGGPVEALAAFAARRRERVRWVRQRTHKRDRIRGLPTLLRDLALRAGGKAIYEADYRPLFAEP